MGTDIDLTPQQRLEKKLDRVLQILDGAGPEVPGLLHTVRRHDKAIFGDGHHAGIVQDVRRLKQFKGCALGTLSAAFGSAVTIAIRYLITGHV